ncbi:hypothetical protein D3C87_1329880 [compost metagenome]
MQIQRANLLESAGRQIIHAFVQLERGLQGSLTQILKRLGGVGYGRAGRLLPADRGGSKPFQILRPHFCCACKNVECCCGLALCSSHRANPLRHNLQLAGGRAHRIARLDEC